MRILPANSVLLYRHFSMESFQNGGQDSQFLNFSEAPGTSPTSPPYAHPQHDPRRRGGRSRKQAALFRSRAPHTSRLCSSSAAGAHVHNPRMPGTDTRQLMPRYVAIPPLMCAVARAARAPPSRSHPGAPTTAPHARVRHGPLERLVGVGVALQEGDEARAQVLGREGHARVALEHGLDDLGPARRAERLGVVDGAACI